MSSSDDLYFIDQCEHQWFLVPSNIDIKYWEEFKENPEDCLPPNGIRMINHPRDLVVKVVSQY